MNATYPPIQPGTAVKTIQSNISHKDDWTEAGWVSKKWGVKGTVITHHDSHGLCYDVKHEDGTVGCYDPSELEIILPQMYLLTAEAKWTASCEHPGGKRDIHTPESRALLAKFEAPDLETARIEAKRRLGEFENELPKKRDGGLSWQNEDAKIVATTFSMIMEL